MGEDDELFRLGSHIYNICVLADPEKRGLIAENCETAKNKNEEMINKIEKYVSLIRSLGEAECGAEEIKEMFGFDSDLVPIPIKPYTGSGFLSLLMVTVEPNFTIMTKREKLANDLESTGGKCRRAADYYNKWLLFLKEMKGSYSNADAMVLVKNSGLLSDPANSHSVYNMVNG